LRAAARWLARFELPLLLPFFLAGAAVTRSLPVVVAVALLFWPIRWLAAGRLSVRTPGDWAVGLLLLMVPVTLWATALPEVTRPQVYRLLTGIALYYAVVNWSDSPARLRWLGMGIMAAGLLLALSAPVTVQWIAAGKLLFIPEAIYRRLPLLLPDPIHPNVMAGALVILLPCALTLPLFGWRELRWFERILTVVAALTMLSALVLTKSRGGLMALGALLVVLIVLRWRLGWLAVPVAALAGGLAIWRIGWGKVVDALTATQTLGGLDGRLEVWSRALYMTQDFPFTGIGMGTFRQVANVLYPFFLAGPDADIPHAHNLFLQVAVDLGLPGLVAWLAIFLLVCWSAWRVYRRGWAVGQSGRLPCLAGLGAGLLGSQVALVVHGLTDAVTWGTRPAVVVWAAWGVAMASWNLVVSSEHHVKAVQNLAHVPDHSG
jgi:putative inorganic carbon (HCO3(-)) transporter